MITASQVRGARAMLRWSAERLADEASLGVATVRRAEAAEGELPVTPANERAIRSALEAAGIEFEGGGDNPTVRFKYASAIEETAHRQIQALLPGSSNWEPTGSADRGFDLRGTGPDGREVLIEVKGAHADRSRAVKMLAGLRSSHPEARLILLLVGGNPPQWDADGDVEIFQVPFTSDWSGLREVFHQERQFRKGENVRLRDGTSLWGERKDSRGKVGRVHTVDDGTPMKRMTIAYPDGGLIENAACGFFEFVPPSKA